MGRAVTPRPTRHRTRWQRKRDDALRKAGYSKTDVWRVMRQANRPSVAGVRAVLDGRYRDAEVQRVFVTLLHPERDDIDALIDKYFPVSEPTYRGPPQEQTHTRRVTQ